MWAAGAGQRELHAEPVQDGSRRQGRNARSGEGGPRLGEQIQVLEGLKEGDTVILSDMSRWDNVDRIRLE